MISTNSGTIGWIRRKVAFHFLAVRTVVGEHILEMCLVVRTVVGGNILYVRILEKMTNHFLRNPYQRPEILWSGIVIQTNPGTIG